MRAIKDDLTEIKNGFTNKPGSKTMSNKEEMKEPNMKMVKDEIKAMNNKIDKFQQETSSLIESKMGLV